MMMKIAVIMMTAMIMVMLMIIVNCDGDGYIHDTAHEIKAELT